MVGESEEENNLFYICGLIEFISRLTKNTKRDVIQKLGKDKIKKMYELAEVYHCENIEKIANEFINEASISNGGYDYIDNCKYRVPTYWEIAKVYKRLIVMVDDDVDKIIDTTIEVLSSWIIDKIDNYNSSLFYENPEYIYECYINGEIL